MTPENQQCVPNVLAWIVRATRLKCNSLEEMIFGYVSSCKKILMLYKVETLSKDRIFQLFTIGKLSSKWSVSDLCLTIIEPTNNNAQTTIFTIFKIVIFFCAAAKHNHCDATTYPEERMNRTDLNLPIIPRGRQLCFLRDPLG